jgi:hypothetical protein
MEVLTMRLLNLAVTLLLAAGPCAAAMQDIVLLPEGTVQARANKDGAWVNVNSGVKIKAGAEIQTGKDSKAGLLFPDGSRFMLGNETLFKVEETSPKTAGFRLMFGKLKAAVSGYFASRFEVRTPAAVCAVRGTQFDVDVAKGGATEMNVAEGLVEVNDTKGKMAVVSSEERIKVDMDGMKKPETVSLKDDHAEAAARPMAVRQETARERTRTMMEELRNRELKANEAQLGKDAIDAFGKRVRLEEYLLRPSDSEFKVLFLSKRSADRLDWGSIDEKFYAKIPDDISQVGEIIDGMYFSKTAPANWMTNFEVYLTNTVDSIKETIAFGAPTLVDFSGYGAGIGSRYYPASIDYTQTLSGPGVALAWGAGTNAPGLASDERVQFEQKQEWNTVTAPNQFMWTQKVVDKTGALSILKQVTLDPSNPADVTATFTSVITDNTSDTSINPSDPVETSPSGPGKADYSRGTTYADGSTLISRKILVANEGDILDISGSANSATFLATGSYNLEMVVDSNLFQGRKIDVLFAPEILSQKSQATTTADGFSIK